MNNLTELSKTSNLKMPRGFPSQDYDNVYDLYGPLVLLVGSQINIWMVFYLRNLLAHGYQWPISFVLFMSLTKIISR